MRALPTLSANDGLGFHMNMPVSELIEHDPQAIEASVVSLAPPVTETEDGVTHEIWLTPNDPHEARGLEPPDPRSSDRGSKAAHEGPEAASRQTELGGKADEPQRPVPVPLRSRQGHLKLLVQS